MSLPFPALPPPLAAAQPLPPPLPPRVWPPSGSGRPGPARSRLGLCPMVPGFRMWLLNPGPGPAQGDEPDLIRSRDASGAGRNGPRPVPAPRPGEKWRAEAETSGAMPCGTCWSNETRTPMPLRPPLSPPPPPHPTPPLSSLFSAIPPAPRTARGRGPHANRAPSRAPSRRTCFAASTLAPLSSSSFATSTLPCCAATMRLVAPPCEGRQGGWRGGTDESRAVLQGRHGAPAVGVKRGRARMGSWTLSLSHSHSLPLSLSPFSLFFSLSLTYTSQY